MYGKDNKQLSNKLRKKDDMYKNIGFISNFVENGIKFGKSVYVKS